MSRAFLKHDLYYMTTQNDNNKKKEEERIKEQERERERDRAREKELKKEFESNKRSKNEGNDKKEMFDAEKALEINMDEYVDDIDDEFKKLLQSQKSVKKDRELTASSKKILFTPKSTLKAFIPQSAPENISVRGQYENERKEKREMWKLREDLKKVIKPEEGSKLIEGDEKNEEKIDEEGKEKLKTADKEKESDEEDKDNEKKSKKSRAKTTGKKKKIKKEDNYVKLDLKRKYRDRFVGGLSKNVRMMTKNGRIKQKYSKDKIGSELEMEDGDIYNSYIISLSKALFFTVVLDEDGEIEETEMPQYSIPKTYELEDLQKLIQDLFGFETFRPGQYKTIRNILEGKSTLFISETASGKSLTYLLSSIIMKGLTIVVSPLVSLMLDQIDHLPSDLPAACISSLLNYEQRDRILGMVKEGKIQILYITPESFLTDFMYHVRDFPPISLVCIDEAHSLSELSHSFRASYLSLEEIVLKYLKYKTSKPVVLCLTATANSETTESIREKLKIEELVQSNCIINKNLFVTISQDQGESKYKALLEYLRHREIAKIRGILVYCRTKRIMFEVFNYLRNSSVLCFIFHSGLPQREKVETMEKFRKGEIRIVLSTVALGMGLDFENLDCVIHINMPKSVENFIQETGRAGRRQKRAYCHLFLDKKDYFIERNYFLADELDESSFLTILNILKNPNIDGRKKEKTSEDKAEGEVESLKRLTMDEADPSGFVEENKREEEEIFEEEEEEPEELVEALENYLSKQEAKKKEKELEKSNSEDKEVCEAGREDEHEENEEEFKKIYYCKADLITERAYLKQEAILNVLLKIQKHLGKQYFKILPMSYETLKISFFKKNEETIKAESEFFRTLVKDCKLMKGSLYINLINKCNEFKMTPIMLLSEIYGISNSYCIKIELISETFLWQHGKSAEWTFQQLSEKETKKCIIEDFNLVQRTALTKFNIFYSLCFNKSRINMDTLIRSKEIISQKDPIPANNIFSSFDEYFRKETYEFYREIVRESQTEYEIEANKATEASYLPFQDLTEENKKEAFQCVKAFFEHMRGANVNKKFLDVISPYKDGKIMTRIFMGINDTNSSWKTYGEHPYWAKLYDKDYRELLKVVQSKIKEYLINYGPQILEFESSKATVSIKKE